jgi:hypothetical protein
MVDRARRVYRPVPPLQVTDVFTAPAIGTGGFGRVVA